MPASSDAPGSVSIDGQMRVLGLPRSCTCRRSSSSSPSAGNSGRPSSSSESTQPTDHMSTAGPYATDPSSTSGARYHSVTHFGVTAPASASTPFTSAATAPSRCAGAAHAGAKWRAMPKSHSLSSPCALYSRFDILMSLCITHRSWRKATARSSCRNRHLTSATLKGKVPLGAASTTRPKSCSQYSNTRNRLSALLPVTTRNSSTTAG
mmetsp:Transcript_27839/g.82571  ORF Transcript_27839/g.82571 Transcript_27839/m.82571 type:complete len:208 (+) Transcript_27839:798-1421(+)